MDGKFSSFPVWTGKVTVWNRDRWPDASSIHVVDRRTTLYTDRFFHNIKKNVLFWACFKHRLEWATHSMVSIWLPDSFGCTSFLSMWTVHNIGAHRRYWFVWTSRVAKVSVAFDNWHEKCTRLCHNFEFTYVNRNCMCQWCRFRMDIRKGVGRTRVWQRKAYFIIIKIRFVWFGSLQADW